MSRGPTREVAEGVLAAASAGVELSRLQARLFRAEARVAQQRLAWSAAGLGLGVASVLYAVPMTFAAAAVLIGAQWGFSPAACVLAAGIVLLVLGATTSVAVYQFARRRPWFPRSIAELRRNLDALWPK